MPELVLFDSDEARLTIGYPSLKTLAFVFFHLTSITDMITVFVSLIGVGMERTVVITIGQFVHVGIRNDVGVLHFKLATGD